MMPEHQTVYTVNSQCPCTKENDGRYRLYNPDTDMITHITEEGKSILDLFDGTNSIEDICFVISEIDDIYASEKGRKIFLDFVRSLEERGIIRHASKNVEIKP